jgi:hypothetical protein
MTTTTTRRLSGRSLVSDDLFERLVRRITVGDGAEPIERQLAVRIVDQAVAFLGACAEHEGEPLAPSALVDIGWHAFILHTREYTRFCYRVAGRYLHHAPKEPGIERTSNPHEVRNRTLGAMRSAGFVVDEPLWALPADCNSGGGGGGNCHQCHAGCHNSP